MARPLTLRGRGRPTRRASAPLSPSPAGWPEPRSGRKRGVRGGVPESSQGEAAVSQAARRERRSGSARAVGPGRDSFGYQAGYERGAHGREPGHRGDRWDPALSRYDLEGDGSGAVYRAFDGESRRGYGRGTGRDPRVSGHHGRALWGADTLLDGGCGARGDRAWGTCIHGQDRLRG